MQTGRWWTGLCVVALLSAAAVAQETRRPSASAQKDPQAGDVPAAQAKIGQAAPDFTLVDCQGKKHALSDYKDKVLVLEWVNQKCPYSVTAVPFMKDVHKKYASKGVVWLGVDSSYGRTAAENATYIKDKELDFTILMDGDGQVGRTYGAHNTPQVFIINKGTLVYMGAIHSNQGGAKKGEEVRNYVAEALDAVLAGKPVPLAETTPWGCKVAYRSGGDPSAASGVKPVGQDKKEK